MGGHHDEQHHKHAAKHQMPHQSLATRRKQTNSDCELTLRASPALERESSHRTRSHNTALTMAKQNLLARARKLTQYKANKVLHGPVKKDELEIRRLADNPAPEAAVADLVEQQHGESRSKAKNRRKMRELEGQSNCSVLDSQILQLDH